MGFKDLPREIKELIRSFNKRPVAVLQFIICREIKSLSSEYQECFGDDYWDRRCFSEIRDFVDEYCKPAGRKKSKNRWYKKLEHFFDERFEGVTKLYAAHIKSKTRP